MNSVRLADTRFVLDELLRLRAGVDPHALHRKLPTGLREAIDTRRVGMFGHSLGGAMAAQAMAADPRIHAGIDLDGTILVKKRSMNPKLDEHLARQLGHRPFMLFTRQGHDIKDDPTLAGFWAGLSGWRLFLALRDAQHFTFTDLAEFLSQLLAAGIAPHYITRKLATEFIGTIQSADAVAAERAYIAAFFDLQLRGQHSALLQGPSPQYPQILFLRR